MAIFDSKIFNSEVFGKYLETVPRVKQNALLRAGILRERKDLKNLFPDQTGGHYATIPMGGLIGGAAQNYDGATDLTAEGLTTYSQGMIVIGRMKGFEEKDFSTEMTGVDFMANIAAQLVDYIDDLDQLTILKELEGIFKNTDNGFATKHTLDITAENDPYVNETTLNTCITQAAGANKGIYKAVICHSEVAKTLENKQLVDYAKYTDVRGIERQIEIYTWGGRTVFVDDDVPVEEVAAAGADPAYNKYTTYVLGEGAFDYVDCGAKVPIEPYRDPKTAGGKDMLFIRQRKIFAPRGFSYTDSTILSPADTDLIKKANWAVVKDATNTQYFDSKAIPFARIISRG